MTEGKRRILLVDDEPDIVLTIGKRLEMSGFDVFTAGDGEEALVKAKEMPDLIILDLMLPKRSGLHVCTTLRKDQQYDAIPIVLFTAKGDDDMMTEFRSDKDLLSKWGADAYVQKTDGPAVLLQTVNILLSKHRGT